MGLGVFKRVVVLVYGKMLIYGKYDEACADSQRMDGRVVKEISGRVFLFE